MPKEAHFATKGNRSPLDAPAALLERLAELDPEGDAAAPLVSAIAAMSAAYTVDRGALGSVGRSSAGRRARLRFFLPRDLPKALRPLLELARRGLLPARGPLRVLDLGAGLGTTSLSVARALHLSGEARPVEVLAVDDDSAALELFERLAARRIEGFAELRLRTRAARLPAALETIDGPFDLVTIGLALNEDLGALSLVERAAERLSPGGIALVVEPALRETTRALMRIRDAVAERGQLAILGPCPHHAPCPMLARPRDWCHDAADVALPAPLDDWARAAGLRDDRPTFAWLALSRRARTDREAHRAVSHRLKTKGKLEIVACSPQGELERLRRLDRDASGANAALEGCARGDLIRVGGTKRGEARIVRGDDVVETA